MRPETGEKLGGYLLEEELRCSGAMTTYRGCSGSDNVVVKVLSIEETEDWKSVELFERSVETLSGLELEGVPGFLDYVEDDERGLRVLVREYLPGESIAERLEAGWHPTEMRVRELAREALRILERLHERHPPIVHRDIKPANLILDDREGLSLIDFGVVRNEPRPEETDPGTVVGTYGYMAPEQFRGDAAPATDLYGLGATLLRIVTGRDPSELPNEEFRIRFRDHADIDEPLSRWLETMTAPSLDARFETARAARRGLDPDALRDTVAGDDAEGVEIADTVPDRSDEQSRLQGAVDGDHMISPDVTAARLMERAPESCRIEGDVLKHCLEFRLRRSGLSELGRGWTGRLVAAGATLVLLAAVFSGGATCITVGLGGPVGALIALGLYRGLRGQVVQVGKDFLQVKYRFWGKTYASRVRTEVDHVEMVDAFLTANHGKKLRIWSGIDEFLDVGGHLSPPELNWFQSLLTFCLDHPEAVRRSELFRERLDSELLE